MGEIGHQTSIFDDMPPSNGWPNRSSQPCAINFASSYFEKEFEDVGRLLTSCGVRIQSNRSFCYEIFSF